MTMDGEAVAITWADAEEKARVERLTGLDAEMRAFFDGGVKDAVTHVLPGLGRGEIGGTVAAIDAALDQRIRFTLTGLRREMGANEDQCFLYRTGFLCAARAARNRFVAQLAALDKAIEATVLLTAGLDAAAEAVGMMASIDREAAPVGRHLLDLLSRPAPRPLATGPAGALSLWRKPRLDAFALPGQRDG